ncbi:hypothetical protein ACH5RR_025717 [Cinchona calisaya]|uniref:Retrotransposon gag domain-containing protein n=1 Tax=Cinchona calisaya TaxID=153742 RepID=A0ABD2Z3T5_9GENT
MRSVDSFTDLTKKFLRHFMSRKTIQRKASYLLRVQQRQDEMLKQYIGRFNDEDIHICNADETMLIAAFMSGIRPGMFNADLASSVTKTFGEFLQREDDYIWGKESNRAKTELQEPRDKVRKN